MFFGDIMLAILNKILWAVATSFILFSGLYFTFKLKFIQFDFKNMFKSLFSKENKNEEISPIQTFLLSLGGRIGVGSIAGIALSIYIGGIGTIFWMWVTSLLLISNSFAETILGNIYKRKTDNGGYNGGPSYYLCYGTGKKYLGILYAILILISYIGGFMGIQANTITKLTNNIYNINPYIVGLIICFLTFFIIFGGLKKIIDASTKLVPIMAIIYLGMSFLIIFLNFSKIPDILILIFKEAFNFKSFLFGFLPTFIIGLQRGIFSNEAGLGTGSIASSSSTDESGVRQGYIQMVGIYISILICTVTVFVILLSDYSPIINGNINGIEIVEDAFFYHFGKTGIYTIFISIILFSFSTIIAGYYYGENALIFLFRRTNKESLLILKIVTIIIVFIGSIMSSSLLWNLVDMMVAILSILNIYALIFLRKEIVYELDCQKSKKCDKIKNR